MILMVACNYYFSFLQIKDTKTEMVIGKFYFICQ